MSKRKTTKKFIEEAKKVHGDKYDYSKTEYINAKSKVCIICPSHGEFWQSPDKHLIGHGCSKCSKNGVKHSLEDFKNKVDELYHNKIYVANDAVYVNSHTKIKMICSKHGEFWSKPNDIFNKHSCPKCGNEKTKEKISLTAEGFIKKAKEIHHDIYDYKSIEYNGYNTMIKIICHEIDKNGKEHGIFLQTPHSHLSGCGCPKCKMSNLERKICHLLEENNIEYEYEKKFKWLGKQSLDFYLPKYNVAIECQGIQHFKPCNFGSVKKNADEMLVYVRECDERKYNMCNKNGVMLLYYRQEKLPAWIINKNDYFSKKEDLIKAILKNGRC